MTCATILRRCRRAEIRLAPSPTPGGLKFDAPAGAVTPELRTLLADRKWELLAVLVGDYAGATAAMLSSVKDAGRRHELLEVYDERAGIAQYDGGMDEADAERAAYIELALAVEGGGE